MPALPSGMRRLRGHLRRLLPSPRVRDRIMVLYNRESIRTGAARAGLFSEFHSVLGALAYGRRHGAAGVRVDYRSSIYLDPPRGPNWWLYYFENDLMAFETSRRRGEVHLDRAVAQFGRYGGFCDVVSGPVPHFYPMLYGVSRSELHQLIARHIVVRETIRATVDAFVDANFAGRFVVGVHYRGTDSARYHYPYHRIPYTSYAEEVRRILDRSQPANPRIFVATDEIDFLEVMRLQFGDAVLCWDHSPRTVASAPALHFDPTLPVTNYEKGESAVIDALLLARTQYLVKGRSNLSDASLAFNPTLPYSFCLR